MSFFRGGFPGPELEEPSPSVSATAPETPAASASASPNGATMHTSSGTLSSTALFPQPTGPEGNRPLPLAPDASRTRCFTPARSINRSNASLSSSSVVVRAGVATSNGEADRATRRCRRAIDRDERRGEGEADAR